MPTYVFEDINTGEVSEKVMKMSELDKFKEDNPHMKTVIQSQKVISGRTDHLTQAGDGFKEIQQKIKSGMPPKDRHLIRTK